MVKKLFLILALAVVAYLAAACGGTGNNNVAPKPTANHRKDRCMPAMLTLHGSGASRNGRRRYGAPPPLATPRLLE